MRAIKERIEMSAGGWQINVSRDGSAAISYEQSSIDITSRATAPAGSVNFEMLQKQLNAEFQKPSSQEKPTASFYAGIRMQGQESLTMRTVPNIEIWNHLIEQLEPKLEISAVSTFKKTAEKYPLKILAAKSGLKTNP